MTGGAGVHAPQLARPPGIYDRILQDLAAQYVLGYVSDDPPRDGKFRKLKVTAKVPGLSVGTGQGTRRSKTCRPRK